MIGNTKQYMMFESIFLIGDMSISKSYVVEFVMSLASLKVNQSYIFLEELVILNNENMTNFSNPTQPIYN